MNLFSYFRDQVVAALEDLASEGAIAPVADAARVGAEPPRDPAHGDVSTNAALVVARQAGVPPRRLGELLAERLGAHESVTRAAVAGPGFVNLWLDERFWHRRLLDVLEEGTAYGASDLGRGEKVNVEYVSANPTGPLHVGHGRGAVVGDALASLLERVGYDVTREFYINDAGAQVDALARSLHLRYREALGEKLDGFPEGLYPGDYLKPVARALVERDGDKWRDLPEDRWLAPLRDFAVAAMMELIREDLAALGVTFDVYTSERRLVEEGAVDAALKELERRDLVYTGILEPPKGKRPEDWEPRPQTLFRATRSGDDVDRPLKKSDGSWTYFATDIAYHLDKYRRGFATMINVWGADHGGYVKRMQAAVRALTDGKGSLDVKLCQLVNLLERGQPARMSKRAGAFVTLRQVIEAVGRDVVRFIMLTRKNDMALDFDLAKVTEHSRDNPVFYVQYAHARSHSVFLQAGEILPDVDLSDAALRRAPLERLTDPAEIGLIRKLAAWPRVLESAAESHEPHRLAFYMHELAADFHALWTKGKEQSSLRFIVEADVPLTLARLALVRGVALVISSGLGVFGVEPVDEMR